MPDLVLNEDGFPALSTYGEPPEGQDALAQQEAAAATEPTSPPVPAPPVVGRTYALDLQTGRFAPMGALPTSINGEAAMRQAILKALTTSRGSAAVQGDDYGREAAERDAEGQPFDAASFATLEANTTDALLALPWVLAVEDFQVTEYPDPTGTSTGAVVTFRVIPEGDEQPIQFDPFPLPSA